MKKSGFRFGELFAKLTERMKQDKHFELCVYGVLVLIGVLVYVGTSAPKEGNGSNNDQVPVQTVWSGERETEERLENILSCIRGAGRVEVMITYDTGTQIVPAMSTDTQTGITENSGGDSRSTIENRTESSRPATVSQNGGNEAIVLTEKQPVVRGVIVIAEGAADIAVRLNLQNAVRTVLGVELSSIEVFEMKAIEKGTCIKHLSAFSLTFQNFKNPIACLN